MKYISLKEASLISGYAPDYVGQLIRQGKLPGKQVYSNVAWVTTEDALREYLKKQPRAKQGTLDVVDTENIGSEIHRTDELIDRTLPKFLKVILYGVVAVSLCFAVILFYIISVQIDSKVKASAVKKSQANISVQK